MPAYDACMSPGFLLTWRLCSKGECPREGGSRTESCLLSRDKVILISNIAQPRFATTCVSRRSALPLPHFKGWTDSPCLLVGLDMFSWLFLESTLSPAIKSGAPNYRWGGQTSHSFSGLELRQMAKRPPRFSDSRDLLQDALPPGSERPPFLTDMDHAIAWEPPC